MFVDTQEKVTTLQLVMDERMFSDTVLRVVRILPNQFVVYDIRYLNGVNLFESLSYESRKAKLHEILDLFHFPDFASLIEVEDVPFGIPVRGDEHYDSQPGTIGVFLPANE